MREMSSLTIGLRFGDSTILGCMLTCCFNKYLRILSHLSLCRTKGHCLVHLKAAKMDFNNGGESEQPYFPRRIASDGTIPFYSYCSRRVHGVSNFYVGESSSSAQSNQGEILTTSFAPVGEGRFCRYSDHRDASFSSWCGDSFVSQSTAVHIGDSEALGRTHEGFQLDCADGRERVGVNLSNNSRRQRRSSSISNTTRVHPVS